MTLTVDAENISALTFQLDYDQTCIHIDDASSDVSGLPSGNGFANSVIDDPANGLLDISIWDTEETQTALTSGYVAVIEFTLEALCRTNNADTDIVFSFSSDPAVTFGATNGSSVSGASYSGTYTLDINQLPSSVGFTQNDSNATENVSGSRSVGTLSATDLDGSDSHTFALATTCTAPWDNQGFGVSSNTLITDRTFNYEGTGTYTVCVQANDGQGGIFAETVTVTVIDANDTPTAIELSANSIVEGSAISTTIGTFTSTDEDAGETFTYSLVSGTGSTDNDSFDIVDGALVVSDTLDYDSQALYKIRVRTTDSESATYDQQFTVIVLGKSVLSLKGEPDVPYVVSGSSINVPINFAAMGNDVVTATFDIDYNDTCLVYAGAGGLTGL
ncbi:MAG: cadherin repeat domain-containing protein, partial [Caldilinea sp.]|nr:cadherin repeat domain-containing protein [Caldilinea sp.]